MCRVANSPCCVRGRVGRDRLRRVAVVAVTDRTTTEIRVVCANYGTAGHSNHVWAKRDMAKARQSVIDAQHRADVGNPTAYYRAEAPYQIQTREVGPWVPYVEGD